MDSLILWGEALVKQQQNQQAIAKFQQALALDSSLDFDPETKVLQTRAEVLMVEAGDLAQSDIEQAFAKMTEALAFEVEMEVSGDDWNKLCQQGARNEHAATALTACDFAVAKSDRYKKPRAIARALTNDLTGALTDLEAFISVYNHPDNIEQIQPWIETLEQGENPFTEEILEELK